MQHRLEVIFHTGDPWGRGCASGVVWEVVGSQSRLESTQCMLKHCVPVAADKRAAAVLFAASREGTAGRQRNTLNGGGVGASAGGPPLERRNLFSLFAQWLQSSGGLQALKQLVAGADQSADGVLVMEEVKQLLARAVPSVSDLEAQLFVSMVDVNGDGELTEAELLQSIEDCSDIDAIVAAGGTSKAISAPAEGPEGAAPGAAPATPVTPALGGGGNMVGVLAALVQHLRSNVAAIDAKLNEMKPAGGYLTYAQLKGLLQAVVPEEMGGRAALRALVSHIARTAKLSASDPGVHVQEFRSCFGLQPAVVSTVGGPAAAVAAGWLPGRPRDIFRLLRYHAKHNRAQLDELFPRGSELTVDKVRHLVRQIFDSRVGEPPLTGRETRLLVAALDVNGNELLSREEFDGGLKECREISAAMSKVYGSSLNAISPTLDLASPMYPHVAGEEPPPSWGQLLEGLRQLHDVLSSRHEEVQRAWRLYDRRGKGRIDACELRKLLLEVVPGFLTPQMLRVLLVYLDAWDPSEHAVLSYKHLLMALRGDAPPDSLRPPPPVPLATATDGFLGVNSPSLQGLSQRLTQALYGGSGTGAGLLPDPEDWQKWHGNVKTRYRQSGAVVLGGAAVPLRDGFWKAQWRWHTAWLKRHAEYRQGLAVCGSVTAAAAAAVPGAGAGAGGEVNDSPPNAVESRMWPFITIEAVPVLGSIFEREGPKTVPSPLEAAPAAPAAEAPSPSLSPLAPPAPDPSQPPHRPVQPSPAPAETETPGAAEEDNNGHGGAMAPGAARAGARPPSVAGSFTSSLRGTGGQPLGEADSAEGPDPAALSNTAAVAAPLATAAAAALVQADGRAAEVEAEAVPTSPSAQASAFGHGEVTAATVSDGHGAGGAHDGHEREALEAKAGTTEALFMNAGNGVVLAAAASGAGVSSLLGGESGVVGAAPDSTATPLAATARKPEAAVAAAAGEPEAAVAAAAGEPEAAVAAAAGKAEAAVAAAAGEAEAAVAAAAGEPEAAVAAAAGEPEAAVAAAAGEPEAAVAAAAGKAGAAVAAAAGEAEAAVAAAAGKAEAAVAAAAGEAEAAVAAAAGEAEAAVAAAAAAAVAPQVTVEPDSPLTRVELPLPPPPPSPPPVPSTAAGGGEGETASSDMRWPLKVPPLVCPSRVLSYEVVLGPGAQLGNFEWLNIHYEVGKTAWWYLDRVTVVCHTSDPPLLWEVTVRRWMEPKKELRGLRADAMAWEEWDMQVPDNTAAAPSTVLYLNPNLQQAEWRPPPPPPFPGTPGAVPHPRPPLQSAAVSGLPHQPLREWLPSLPPNAVHRVRVRYLDTLRSGPAFKPTRVRAGYGLGFGGALGTLAGQRVLINGEQCSHSIAVQARGGFKWVDPDDPNIVRLLPAIGATAGSVYGGGAADQQGSTQADVALTSDPLGGGLVPGVRECVVLSYNLERAGEMYDEKYGWLYAHVALDDSAGTPPAPVRFSVVLGETLAWAAWVRGARDVVRCCVPLADCRQLHLVVESDFSAGALCVWVDPCLVVAPVLRRDVAESLARDAAAAVNEVAAYQAQDVKVEFRREAEGDIVYMAPVRSVPPEVARFSNTAHYRISIFTAPDKNSGTRGKVYVRLSGRRTAAPDAAPVKSRAVCINEDGSQLREGDKYTMPDAVLLPYMEEIDSIELQHNPAPAGFMGGSTAIGGRNDWNIQHVEVFCEATGRMWYFAAKGWFLELAAGQLEAARAEGAGAAGGGSGLGARLGRLQPADAKVTLPRVTSELEFKVVVHIISSGKGKGMGIEGDLKMVLVGVGPDGYQNLPITLPASTIDRPHETRLVASPLPLGELQTVELSCKQTGLLNSRLLHVEVVRLVDGRHWLFSNSIPESDTGATRLVLRAAAQPHFRIATFTSDIPEASTDACVYIDLLGPHGKLMDLHLRDIGGTFFNEGCEDVFFFPDPGLGDLNSVCISHDDSGSSPNWHLDRVEVTNTGTGRTQCFECKKWIGLGAGLQQEINPDAAAPGVPTRFPADRALERVLYPSHVVSSLKTGEPLLRYHAIFNMESPSGQLEHAVEALQLVGRNSSDVQYSDMVILEGHGDRGIDMELDTIYVRSVQAAAARATGLGPAPEGQPHEAQPHSGAAPEAHSGPSATVRTYEVVVRKLMLYQPRANISIGATKRSVVLVLHGSQSSSRQLVLSSQNCTTIGVAPFTSHTDEIFEVAVDSNLGPQLLRLDIRMAGENAAEWGMLLQSLVVRSLSGAELAASTEFTAGPKGQWMGASPNSNEGVVGGAQELRLLPAGMCATSFTARSFEELVVLHVRHDNPAASPGWALRGIDVVAAPAGGSAVPALPLAEGTERNSAEAVTAGTAAASAPHAQAQPVLPVGPRLYHFPSSKQPGSWPSSDRPYIRHLLSSKYLEQPFPAEVYFKPPIIETQKYRKPPPPQPPSQRDLDFDDGGGGGGGGGGAVPPLAIVDPRKTSEMPDPERLQALWNSYVAELHTYQQLVDAGQEAQADIFSVLRARARAEPDFLSATFERLDHDKDGKLTNQQVGDLLSELLKHKRAGMPPEIQCTAHQLSYLAAMVTAGSEEPMAQAQVLKALKSCRSAYKEAASMWRMTNDGDMDWNEMAQIDGEGLELALCRLAEKLVQPAGAEGTAEAFRSYDIDGSGYLEIGELCRALRSMAQPTLSNFDIRLLIAYLFYFGDHDQDSRLAASELQASLVPFVPRPPAQQLQAAYEGYRLSENLPALLQNLHRLQPALLPAACVLRIRAAAGAGEAAGTVGGAGGQLQSAATATGLVPLSALPDIIARVAPDVAVQPYRVEALQKLIALDDSGLSGLPLQPLLDAIAASADAVKRANAIARMVKAAQEEQEPVALEPGLGGAELVLQRMADLLGGEQGTAAAEEAFRAYDKDGSGYLDGPELCAAVRQLHPEIDTEELRTLLAYVQGHADQDSNGRVSLVEMQALLQPFQ